MGVRGAGQLQWVPFGTSGDGPGHRDTGLGADAHTGSGWGQCNTATRP